MSDTVLSARDLRLHYPVRTGGLLINKYKSLKAVDGVSFDLQKGEALGVVGESGCGKSTLGRAVLLLSQPTAGQVSWMTDSVTDMDDKAVLERRRDFQLVFQDPLSSLNPRMTVGDIIAEPLRSFFPELSLDEVQQRVIDIMPRVGLRPNMMLRYPHEFSGGQCQRISIARAIILEPKMLVLDEPVSALDVSVQAQIVNLLKDLQADLGLSYLFISHDLSIVRYVCDRILVMYLGKVVESGSREQLFSSPKHPYTRALIDAIPVTEVKPESGQGLFRAEGELPSPLNPPSGCRFRTRCRFATDRCQSEEPVLEQMESGQSVACHHWQSLDS